MKTHMPVLNDNPVTAYRETYVVERELETLRQEMVKYRNALMEIRLNGGRVCDVYEVCEHRACHSSYASWAIAAKALGEYRND